MPIHRVDLVVLCRRAALMKSKRKRLHRPEWGLEEMALGRALIANHQLRFLERDFGGFLQGAHSGAMKPLSV